MTITEAERGIVAGSHPASRSVASALTRLPVVVIGAGPVGLAAAAHLLRRGIEPLVLEQGEGAGSAILEWGQVRLFSPWKHVTDSAAVELLASEGWTPQHPDALPTGRQLVEHYLRPLAATAALRDRIRYGARVEAVSRQGMDRTRTVGRADAPLVVRVAGDRDEIRARAVIDASGTFSQPNSVLASGLPLRDAQSVAAHVVTGLPDVLTRDRARFAGTHTVVVGAGHSAANTLIALARLAESVPDTRVTWLIRHESPARLYGSTDDELAGRASIGQAVQGLVASGAVTLVTGFLVDDVQRATDRGVRIVGSHAGAVTAIDADTVVVATGFRPELDSLREIRLGLDEVIQAPLRLAPLIDPNLHSCGTVPPHGVGELSHPEPGFWLAGMKSYGRAPTFLLLTGYEQVRSIADELAGRHDEARQIRLALPETGVCSSESSSCC